jgi:RNA polymerase sigma-70 factor (ECF subfamily)
VAVRGETPGVEGFQTVLLAAQSGAGWAWTSIWVEYAPPVAAFVRARGSREPDDLTSEVFLAVFDQLPAFVGTESDFRSFVFSIAYRRLVDELRKRSRRGEPQEWTPRTDPRLSSSAEDDALANLTYSSTLSLLDGLPRDQRDVMVLRIVADLTVEQIALVLDKRPGAVKALQRRALERLRKKFGSARTLSAPANDSGE